MPSAWLSAALSAFGCTLYGLRSLWLSAGLVARPAVVSAAVFPSVLRWFCLSFRDDQRRRVLRSGVRCHGLRLLGALSPLSVSVPGGRSCFRAWFSRLRFFLLWVWSARLRFSRLFLPSFRLILSRCFFRLLLPFCGASVVVVGVSLITFFFAVLRLVCGSHAVAVRVPVRRVFPCIICW